MLRAAGAAQQELQCGLSIHPGRNPVAPYEILEILEGAGADIKRVVIGHIERTIADVEEVKRLAETGCLVEYDLFGMEVTSSFFWEQGIEVPSDSQRLDQLGALIEAGFTEQIVVAQDICQKHRLCTYGGHGYEHIVRNIVPRMHARGFSPDDVNRILVGNPRRVFAVDSANLVDPQLVSGATAS